MQRFEFLSQQPRNDGCGVVVLRMITGLDYDQAASLIKWGDRQVHHMRWEDMRVALATIGQPCDAPVTVEGWAEIEGAAIVHVRPDHFILYDAENKLFYDPAMAEGPAGTSDLSPISYMPIVPNQSRKQA